MVYVQIVNNSDRLVIIKGNSGKYIHLAPKGSSGSINEVEITNNPKVKKLDSSGLISIKRLKKEEKEMKKPEPPTGEPKKEGEEMKRLEPAEG